MPEIKQEPVPVLSDDEVAIIESELKEWDGGSKFPASWSNIRALCATVRALRARIDTLNTLGEEMLTRLEKVADIGMKADHGWYFVVGEIERQHTVLREQLAESRTENERLASQLKEWQEEKDTKAGYL